MSINSLYVKEFSTSVLEVFQESGLEINSIQNNVIFFKIRDVYLSCYHDGRHFTTRCKIAHNDDNYVCFPIFTWPSSGYDYHGPYSSLVDHTVDKKADLKQLLHFLTSLKKAC